MVSIFDSILSTGNIVAIYIYIIIISIYIVDILSNILTIVCTTIIITDIR